MRTKFSSGWRVLLSALQANPKCWWTLAALSEVTGQQETCVSANLRNLRKKQYGAYTIEVRRLNGTYEYKLGA